MKKKWKWGCFLVMLLPGLAAFYLWQADFSKKGVTVAVLDTGIQDHHPLLRDKVRQGFDFIDFDGVSDDVMGHGTHVAGIIATISPEAEILSVRVIDREDRVRRTFLGVLYAVFQGADIVNMSYAESYNFLTDLAIRYGRAKGVMFVASSGNLGVEDVFYPAKYEGVYSVSGWDEEHQRVFGNYGKKVSYLAPGSHIRSASPEGGYTVKTGTSMAAGYVSGVLAYLKSENPHSSNAELEDRLDRIALKVKGSPGAGGKVRQAPMEYKAITLSGLGKLPAQKWNRIQSLSERSRVAMY